MRRGGAIIACTALAVAAVGIAWIAGRPDDGRTHRRTERRGPPVPAPAADGPSAPVAAAPSVDAVNAVEDSVASDAEAAPVIRGIVVDPSGCGVAGVVVRAHFARRHSSGYAYHCGDESVGTDSDGRFRFTVPTHASWAVLEFDAPGWVRPEKRMVRRYGTTLLRALPHGEVEFGTARVEVAADARVLGGQADGEWPTVRVVLERGRAVSGTVETEAGLPVVDGNVSCEWSDRRGGIRRCGARTDERGGFAVIVPTVVHAQARAPDGAEAWVGPVAPGTSDVRLVVRAQPVVRARVFGPDGRFCGGVRLRATDVRHPGRAIPGAYATVSDEREILGRFAPGIYDLEIAPVDAALLPAHVRVALPGPPLDIHVPAAARVEGSLEGDDVRGFEITWGGACNRSLERRDPGAGYGAVAQSGPSAWAREDGAFLLEAVAGTAEVYARREGDPRCAYVARHDATHGYLRLVPVEGRRISGRVEGEGLAHLRVRAVRGALTQETPVRNDGTFELVGLPPVAMSVELVSEGFPRRPWRHDLREDIAPGTTELVLRVRLP
jgi:hypothetical protein